MSQLPIMKAIAKEAGDLLMAHFGRVHISEVKESKHSIVTSLDLWVEKLIIERIRSHFPDHSILTEESGFIGQNSEYLWVIDPLDGSSYYARGINTFCVSIALYKEKKPALAVVYCPCSAELFHAVADEGAYLNDTKILCSETASMSEAVASFGHRYLRLDGYPIDAQALLKSVRSIRGGGSCAMELCYLACGRIDLVLTVNQSFWDYAAALLIAKESGCFFGDLSKQSWDYDKYAFGKFDLLSYTSALDIGL